jgi:hypothetical protein
MRYDSTTSAPASSSRNAKHADVSKTSASATPTVLRPAGEQVFGQSAAREHAACGANRVVGRRVGTSGTPPSLDLLPDGLKLLRRQRPDLIQYGLGLRAHGFNLTCSPLAPGDSTRRSLATPCLKRLRALTIAESKAGQAR